jgi:all-trans-8'-apo-beta-carotenal 15,15'-oxygenase
LFHLLDKKTMTSTELRTASETSYERQDWQRGYESLHTEHAYWITDIEGTIPLALAGTLFRNGPGRLDINGHRFHHPFDGDGMVCGITFKEGKAFFRNRYVRTEGYLAETAAGKICYRGVFGTQKPGGWLANAFDLTPKHVANTSVLFWNQQLLALWEAGLPYRLDPTTLETLEPSTLNGLLQPTDAWSAHPRIDPASPRILVNFAVKPGLLTSIVVDEVDEQGERLQRRTESIPGFAFIHDFAITPNYYIFFQNPVVLNPIPFVLGFRTAGQCISFKPNLPTKVLLIPRNLAKPMQVLNTESCFVFHHANAYESDGEIIVDSICYEKFPTLDPDADFREINFETLPEGQLWRFKIQPDGNRVQHQVITQQTCEFPTLHPQKVGQPYRYLYIGTAHPERGNAPLQAIAKFDLEAGTKTSWSAAPRGFVGEPIFVPKPNQGLAEGEDRGWLLVMVYSAAQHQSELVILDAADLQSGTIARLRLSHHVPYGLHGCFTSETCLCEIPEGATME